MSRVKLLNAVLIRSQCETKQHGGSPAKLGHVAGMGSLICLLGPGRNTAPPPIACVSRGKSMLDYAVLYPVSRMQGDTTAPADAKVIQPLLTDSANTGMWLPGYSTA